MADGKLPVLSVSGKVNASNALVVRGDSGAATGAVGPLSGLMGTATVGNALLVVFA